MTKKIWTNEAYQALFEEVMVLKHNGKPLGRYTTGWKYYPVGVTIKEWYAIGDKLRTRLIERGVFPLKAPKSGMAVCQQLAHATTPSSHPSFASMRARLRMIAYHTGFMDMADIVAIETEAKTRTKDPTIDMLQTPDE